MYNKLKYAIEISSWFRNNPHAQNTKGKETTTEGQATTPRREQGKPKTLPQTHKATDKACEKFQTKPKENAHKFKMKHACKIQNN